MNMTEIEAKQEIEHNVYHNTDDYEMKISKECYKTMINALEKQVAKKPEVWANGTEHCPCCEKDVTNLYFKLCVECGQRLEDEEPIYIPDYVER